MPRDSVVPLFKKVAIEQIGFDPSLRGGGAKLQNEMIAGFAVKRAGWRLVYDPKNAAYHFSAQRFDRDGRGQFGSAVSTDHAHNFRLALDKNSSAWRRRAALIWHQLVHTREKPALASLLGMLVKRDPNALQNMAQYLDGADGT